MSNLLAIAVHFFKRQFRSIPVPITSYAGRTVIVTGANGGLGLESARHFARLGAARVILACRNTERGEAAKADIERTLTPSSTILEVWPLDLCSFDSVRAFCRRADKELDRLDVLLANAAVLSIGSPKMAEGYEMQVLVNVITNFLMVLMLLPLMRSTAARWNVEPAVTVVASEAHFFTKFVEKDQPRIFESFRPGRAMHDRYGTTKLLDILLVQELAERLDAASAGSSPIVVNTANPGLCESSLFRDIHTIGQFLLSVAKLCIGRTSEEGSRALMAAVAGGRESHGKYVDSGKVDDPSPFVLSEKGKEVQKKVWDELVTLLSWYEDIETLVSGNVTQVVGRPCL
ncbi:NAD(P)-binding protein [Parathielavia appendiculata]|uniref:NAD(P)-binding protein n=1 Tax=Parathielavia appendiculata TaxID=2587402 RepID=A0AAN6U6Y8_9PEZI|nr:NAD(P)-binding protein [Parathielavia appendiculata]